MKNLNLSPLIYVLASALLAASCSTRQEPVEVQKAESATGEWAIPFDEPVVVDGGFRVDLLVTIEKRPRGNHLVIVGGVAKDDKEFGFRLGISPFQQPYLTVSPDDEAGGARSFFSPVSLRLGREYALTAIWTPDAGVSLFIDGYEVLAVSEGVPRKMHRSSSFLVVPHEHSKAAAKILTLGTMTITSSETIPRPSPMEDRADPRRPVRQVTTPPGHHWFGYYDKEQIDATGRWLLTMRTSFEDRSPEPTDELEVGRIDLNTDEWERLGTTRAWNWQQGSMLQWRPGHPTEVMWNDREETSFVTRILDTATGELRTLPRAIYHVRHDGKEALGLDFGRIETLRRGYGYAGGPPLVPEENSHIYVMNLESGESRTIMSLNDIKAMNPLEYDPAAVHYFNCLQYSPSGDRFLFFHRWLIPNKRGMRTRVFTADVTGGDPVMLGNELDHWSHYVWIDEDHLALWSRRRQAYVQIHRKSGEAEVILRVPNGHQSFLPGTNHRWMVSDTYPDRQKTQRLFLYDRENDEIITLGNFHNPGSSSDQWRVDLHPRIGPDGRTIIVDSAMKDGRQQYLVSVADLVD